MKYFYALLILFSCIHANAQYVAKYNSSALVVDSVYWNTEDRVALYEKNNDSTVYMAIHNIIKSNDPYSYLTILPVFRRIDQRFDLPEGTGQNGFLLEGVLDQRYTILRGRDSNKHLFKLSDFSFYFGYDLRMAQDSSKPLIPSNQRVGFEFRQGLWNSYTRRKSFKALQLKSDTRNWYEDKGDFHLLYFTLLASHYSNGQDPGFYVDISTREHDYKSGDFSTNFIKFNLVYSKYTEDLSDPNNAKRNLLSCGLGYQLDLGTPGALKFSKEQEKSYGYHRLNALLQWRSKYFHWWHIPVKYISENRNKYKIKEYMEFKLRVEPTYILGNLDNYYMGSGQGFLKNEYRFSMHVYTELNFLRNRSISFLLHYYYGRDYYNIRYDRIISTFQVGLSLNLSRMMPLRFNSRESISGVME